MQTPGNYTLTHFKHSIIEQTYCDRRAPGFKMPRSPEPPICHSQTPSTAHADALACRRKPLVCVFAGSCSFSTAEAVESLSARRVGVEVDEPASSSIPATTPSRSTTDQRPSTSVLPRSPNWPFPRRNKIRPRTCQAMQRWAGKEERLRMASSGIV